MGKHWHFNGTSDKYQDIYDQLLPDEPSKPPEPHEPERHLNFGVVMVLWIFTLVISVGYSFLLFYFDTDEAGNVDRWYIIRNSSILKDLGLVLFVELATYLIYIYKQKGLKLKINDSQFFLNAFALILAGCDIFLCGKFATAKSETNFQFGLWISLVVCSCLVCIFGQVEIPKKEKKEV